MSDELAACPFCGATGAEIVFDAVVLCAGCSAEAQPGDWNRRTVTREQVEAMVRVMRGAVGHEMRQAGVRVETAVVNAVRAARLTVEE